MSINQKQQERAGEEMILFKIISRRSWDRLQGYHEACPGSTVEHLYRGMYVLTIPVGGATALGGAHE